MTIFVNGEPTEVDTQITIHQLLEKLGFDPSYIAVAVNSDCVSRSLFAETAVRAGDKLEILAPMAGG